MREDTLTDNLVSKFLDLGVQYFHGTVQTLLQTSSVAYLESVRGKAVKGGVVGMTRLPSVSQPS
jgi:hypothetical protein